MGQKGTSQRYDSLVLWDYFVLVGTGWAQIEGLVGTQNCDQNYIGL